MSRHTVDARNMLCPMPVIRVQEKVEQLTAGDMLEAICTDPGAEHDVPAWCRVHGHELVGIETHDNEIHIMIRVCGDADR